MKTQQGVPEQPSDSVETVVQLVSGVEKHMPVSLIRGVVSKVAGGRAKQRRLAQTVTASPHILTSGQPMPPRVVVYLLQALRDAGAQHVANLACSGCGKHVRLQHNRGQEMLCTPCYRQPQPCSKCGKHRGVYFRDRHGQPRCEACPDLDPADPVAAITQVLRQLGETLGSELIGAAVNACVVRPAAQRRLAWAVMDQPSLLTGDGATAKHSAVLTLIDQLFAAGATAVHKPPCPSCGRTVKLWNLVGGQWICRACAVKTRTEKCNRCAKVRPVCTREQDGSAICGQCMQYDPANHEHCSSCGRLRPVHARDEQGPKCSACRPVKEGICAMCGRTSGCEISQATGQPRCNACQCRWARCSACRTMAQVQGGTITKPLCAPCLNPDPGFWSPCPRCQTTWQLTSHPCHRCAVDLKLHELLSANGAIRKEFAALHRHLISVDRPVRVLKWIGEKSVSTVLAGLGNGSLNLDHKTLDGLPESPTLKHLRRVLVATGTLPARDERLAQLERFTAELIATVGDADLRQVLHRYAVWHTLRRLRNRCRTSEATFAQMENARCHIRAAANFLKWLTAQDLTLTTCRQADIDQWASSKDATLIDETGDFVRWAVKHRNATTLSFPSRCWNGPTGPHDTEQRWHQARKLLHDNKIRASDRVAGLLVLLYAQRVATISRLRKDQIQHASGVTQLNIKKVPITLAEPLAGLVKELLQKDRGRAMLGEHGSSPWLFPGAYPGKPLAPATIAGRLRDLGIHTERARSTALLSLTSELPAGILARMLAISTHAAVRWQRASSGDWASYAAEFSRRSRPLPPGQKMVTL